MTTFHLYSLIRVTSSLASTDLLRTIDTVFMFIPGYKFQPIVSLHRPYWASVLYVETAYRKKEKTCELVNFFQLFMHVLLKHHSFFKGVLHP